LMLGGALEVINDWSYAVVDAPVLEDADDHIWVDLEIAKELEG
ncbi:TPA: tellurite resistance TerB C-terminal domain-containing protein, partial [Escherichia coli]